MNEKRIAWGITGAGHALEECVETLLQCEGVDVFLSRAAEEVVDMYGLDARLNTPRVRIYRENKASSPLVGRLFSGMYRLLVVAPATSNSIAKFIHGISDTLVTNLLAQAGKARIPIVVFPTDLAPEMDSLGPNRESVKVYPRKIDLENAETLMRFEGVEVVRTRAELESFLSVNMRA
jgi:dihydromethanopterin reductase (acceptor)